MRIKIKNILSKYKFSLALALLLFLLFIFFLGKHISIFFAIVNITFIFATLLLVSKVANKTLRGFFTAIISLILSISISFSILFSAPLGLGNIASFLETNLSEISSSGIGNYVIFFACLLTITTLCFYVINELKWLFSAQKASLMLLLLTLFILLSAIAIPHYRNASFLKNFKRDFKELPLQTLYAHSAMRSPILYGDIFGLILYAYERVDFLKYSDQQRSIPQGISYEVANEYVPTIYLVVGESAYRKAMSLYGNSLQTTPFLDSIANFDSTIIDFYDAISIANITRDAVRFSLSFASPFNSEAFWKEKNSIDLANDAGYHTTWLSNQGQSGLYDNYPSYIARSSNYTYFENKLKKDDLDLLPLVQKSHQKGKKQLITIHLMGSHFPYEERYDEVDDLYFQGENSTNMDDDSIFEYEKGIHHTDRFLIKLYYHTIKHDQSSIIVYFSDHGASPQRGIHGLSHAEATEYEIPLVILKNNVSINADSIVSNYIDPNTKLINNLNISYILAQLMGYSVDPATIDRAVQDGQYIITVDGKTIPFSLYR